MKILNKSILLLLSLMLGFASNAQLTISSGATFFIEGGATVTVQGDVTSNADITGTGSLLLKGSAAQNISMNGNIVPNLEMDNAANAVLTSNIKISNALLFTNGKIQLGNNTATLSQAATTLGMGANKFLETNGTGFVRRELNADISNAILPVGAGADYLPIAVTNSGSTYASASIGAQVKGIANSNKHPRTESFLLANWPINKAGITGGTTNATATYTDPSRVVNIEADLRGIFWNGSNWSITGGNQNTTNNTVSADISANNGELYGMNKFIVLDSKVFLQGAYNNGTSLMDDRLRNSSSPGYATYTIGAVPASNVIPASDPYRVAPYSSFFTHVNNSITEVATATAFHDLATNSNNIVDWVFVELRNTLSPGNVRLQTRSALLQRDGDIVDIDGTSALYFKNVDAGNYAITVRHRNHLGMSTNPNSFNQALGLLNNATKLNFSNTATVANFLGTANVNFATNGTVNMLYAGNVNMNTGLRWSAPSSDKDFLLNSILSGNAGTTFSNTYSVGDVNLNRTVRWSAPNSDKDYILSTPLGGASGATKVQLLPTP